MDDETMQSNDGGDNTGGDYGWDDGDGGGASGDAGDAGFLDYSAAASSLDTAYGQGADAAALDGAGGYATSSFTGGLGQIADGFAEAGASVLHAGGHALEGVGAAEVGMFRSVQAMGDVWLNDRDGVNERMDQANQAGADMFTKFEQAGADLGF
jgi:hypothetical protein